MATSNKEIFERFLIIVKDVPLCKLSDADLSSILALYQNAGASLYFKKCRKDLSLYIKGEFYRQTFVGDGVTTDFTISDYPTDVADDSLEDFCQVDSVVPTYSFNDTSLTYSIPTAPIVGADVSCGYDYIGEFTADLTDEECWIIAYTMLIVWVDSKVNVESKLKEIMTTKNYNPLHSPANLLSELRELRKDSFKNYRTLMVSYTRESNPNGLNG